MRWDCKESSASSRGTASFDDICLERVDSVPGGDTIEDFFREKDPGSAAASDDSDEMPARNTESWLMFICVYVLAVIGITRKRGRGANPMPVKHVRLLFAQVFRLRRGHGRDGHQTECRKDLHGLRLHDGHRKRICSGKFI